MRNIKKEFLIQEDETWDDVLGDGSTITEIADMIEECMVEVSGEMVMAKNLKIIITDEND